MVCGILGQGKDGASIRSPGGPEIVHYLSYGGSKLDGDRPWYSVGFAEFSQTEATVFEDNYKPLTPWKYSEEVYCFFNYNFSDLSRWRVTAIPEAVEVCLAN